MWIDQLITIDHGLQRILWRYGSARRPLQYIENVALQLQGQQTFRRTSLRSQHTSGRAILLSLDWQFLYICIFFQQFDITIHYMDMWQ